MNVKNDLWMQTSTDWEWNTVIKIPFLKCVIVPRSALPALEVVQFKLYFIIYTLTGKSGKCANGFGKNSYCKSVAELPS